MISDFGVRLWSKTVIFGKKKSWKSASPEIFFQKRNKFSMKWGSLFTSSYYTESYSGDCQIQSWFIGIAKNKLFWLIWGKYSLLRYFHDHKKHFIKNGYWVLTSLYHRSSCIQAVQLSIPLNRLPWSYSKNEVLFWTWHFIITSGY